MNTKSYICALCMLLTSGPAMSITGKEMAEVCASDPGSAKYAVCAGYLSGLIDGLRYAYVEMSGKDPSPLMPFCLPDIVSTKTKINLVIADFIRSHPALLELPVVFGVTTALADAYPCKK